MESSNTDKMKVAVFAAESRDRQFITQLLDNAGYKVGIYVNGDSMLSATDELAALIVSHRHSPDLPHPTLPETASGQRVVVFSDSTSEQTIVRTLEGGAHHFFNLSEAPSILQARLEAALRQHSLQSRRVLDVAPFKFNLERRNVYKDEKLISLSPKEYEFAYYLFANRHRVVVNAELMTSVWSLPSSMDARRIDTAACRVRKKMQLSEASNGWSLRRIRRVGYKLLWRGEMQDSSVKSTEAQCKLTETSRASVSINNNVRLREIA